MSWVAKLLGRRTALPPSAVARLERWRALPEPDRAVSPAAARFIVVDVESTGLNVRTDRLIAIGAVTIEAARIDLGRAFYAILRQQASSTRENILVHGIGGTQQREGLDPVDALLAFLEFAGKAPLVGYHAAFDNAMIGTATREVLGAAFERPWIDLAYVAPDLFPDEANRRKHLDAWLELFRIDVFSRHDAVADALATAQLLLAALARAQTPPDRVAGMLWDPGASRWLGQVR
jgi:DNA polymerase-3 subunit epsilon